MNTYRVTIETISDEENETYHRCVSTHECSDLVFSLCCAIESCEGSFLGYNDLLAEVVDVHESSEQSSWEGISGAEKLAIKEREFVEAASAFREELLAWRKRQP